MRIAIFSDTHFGHGAGTEMENDSFDAAEEAITYPADFTILAGDIFDTRIPTTETLGKAIECLSKAKLAKREVEVGTETNHMAKSGRPIIAIHGNHERRAKELTNPVHILQKAGLLIHLHCNTATLSKGSERVAVHGMSWIPDQLAEAALNEWSPKPLPGHYNILVLHQNISGLLYAENILPKESLPPGFDLYINGHIHEPMKTEVNGKPLIVPGSAVPTQMKEESEKPKGFWVADTQSGGIEFQEFKSQGPVIVIDHNGNQESLEQKVSERLSGASHEKKPLLRVKMRNSIRKADIGIKFSDRAIVSFRKAYEEESPATKGLEEHKLSVNELGSKLLRENLSAAGLDPEAFAEVFELLLEKRIEKAEKRARESLPGKSK